MKRIWVGSIVVMGFFAVVASACGDDADQTGGAGSTGTGGSGGTGATTMQDPDRFPWTIAVSLVQVDAVSSSAVGDIDEWCDLDDRGEFFIDYRIDPPGTEPTASILDLEFDAGGPTDSRVYGDMLRRTFTISSATDQVSIFSGSSFEEDGILSGNDELSDFNIPLQNIPPSEIDFSDVGCGRYDYVSAIGRTDCQGGCIRRARNTAKDSCYLESTWCVQNVSDPNR